MTVTEYQEWTRNTWKSDYTDVESSDICLAHACMGLAGESGEVVDLFKKMLFTPNRLQGQDYRQEVVKELGDVLYYLNRIADECGITMEEVMETNVNKLEKRYGISRTAS